jgi:hypothetical protein
VDGVEAYLKRIWRAALAADALLSLEEVVEALPVPIEVASDWVRSIDPVGSLGPIPLYRWGDVLDGIRAGEAVDEGPGWIRTEEAAVRLSVGRATLDAMVARAPRDLPGAPVQVGHGAQRRHLRWDPSTLSAWMEAFRAWEARSTVASSVRPRRRRREPMSSDEGGPVDWTSVARKARRG